MIRKIFLLLPIIFFSCKTDNNDLSLEIKKLKLVNDSLRKITDNLKDKFIFDEVGVKIIPSDKNTNKIGSYYEGNFVLIAYNKKDKIHFSTKLDSTDENKLIAPEILKRNYDGYYFKVKLNEKENNIHFNVKMNSKIGKNLDGIIISDKKITK